MMAATQSPPPERLLSAQTRFYVVQRGDTLHEIGKRLGAPWRRLAHLNRLSNPDLIFPGDLIQTEEVSRG